MYWVVATCSGHRVKLWIFFIPESAKVLSHQPQAGGYTLLRLLAPQCAAHAQPGTIVCLTNGSALTHTAPLLRVDGRVGWIEILYSVTSALPAFNMGELITLGIVPGAVFTLPSRPCPLIIGDAIGTAPTVFMADKIRQQKNFRPLILLGYDTAPPFIAARCGRRVQFILCFFFFSMLFLEVWGIPSRIAHTQGQPGCFEGKVDELTHLWLHEISNTQRAETEIFVSGSNDLTNAVTGFAGQYQVPCQTLALAR